jgi:hypothetical protein
MKVIIAGSRATKAVDVRKALDRCRWINFASVVISGTAKGADREGEKWANENGIKVLRFVPNWKELGKRAGPIRNQEMAKAADGLVAVWDGVSAGTKNMIATALSCGLRVFVYRIDTGNVMEWPAAGLLETRWDAAEERAAILEFSDSIKRSDAERQAGKIINENCISLNSAG